MNISPVFVWKCGDIFYLFKLISSTFMYWIITCDAYWINIRVDTIAALKHKIWFECTISQVWTINLESRYMKDSITLASSNNVPADWFVLSKWLSSLFARYIMFLNVIKASKRRRTGMTHQYYIIYIIFRHCSANLSTDVKNYVRYINIHICPMRIPSLRLLLFSIINLCKSCYLFSVYVALQLEIVPN